MSAVTVPTPSPVAPIDPDAVVVSRPKWAHARHIEWAAMTPFALVHLMVLGAIFSGVTWQAVLWGIALYAVRMFAITAGYHRYFSHRTFKTSRVMQFVFAWLAQSSAQRGVMWWAAHHRHHHRASDQADDTHSPKRDGFWYAHFLWIYNHNSRTELSRVRDLAKYPELRWLDRFWWVPVYSLGLVSWLLFGWAGLFVGFAASTVLLWHATFCINSLAHVLGSRRYATDDDSRNNWFLALLTFGEGWHNNHHHYMHSTRQGFRWWELDATYYALKVMSWLGLVWDLREPPAHVLRGEPRAAPTPA